VEGGSANGHPAWVEPRQLASNSSLRRLKASWTRAFWTLVLGATMLIGCPQEWSLSVTDSDDPFHPELCFSRLPRCLGGAAFLSEITVNRKDEHFDGDDIMWMLRPATDGRIKRLRYGSVPEGWIELQPARELVVGEVYCIRRHCIRLERLGDAIEIVVVRGD